MGDEITVGSDSIPDLITAGSVRKRALTSEAMMVVERVASYGEMKMIGAFRFSGKRINIRSYVNEKQKNSRPRLQR